jgi:hypothetical protein
VKIPLPSPARWITVYGYKGDLGFSLVAENGSQLLECLADEAGNLRRETGLADLRFHPLSHPELAAFGISRPLATFANVDDQIAWLHDTGNRLVNALRPRLAILDGTSG